MRLKKSVAACVVVLFFTSAANASIFSDFVRSIAVASAEQQDIQKAPDCTLSADEALVRSIELLSDGRQAEAERFIKSAVKTHRNDVRILFAKGVLERSRWDKTAAQVWFALARKAGGDETLSRAAWISMQLDRQSSVEENMAELIRLSDENPGEIFLLWLGAIHCRDQSRSNSRLSENLKEQMAELGGERYELLFKHFELGPVMAHHTYANILTEDLGDYDTALEHRIKAVSMEAKSWTLEGFADTLTNMKKYRWACVVWEQAAKKNNSNKRYYKRWGDALYRLKENNEAAEKYREAIRLSPKTGCYWKNLADSLLRAKGEKKEIFEAYRRAVELGFEEATHGLGWCYSSGYGVEKDKKKAFELYKPYIESHPESPKMLRELGSYHNSDEGKSRNPAKAFECYEKAVALEPDNWYGLNGLAWTLTLVEDPALRDPPRALKLARRSVKLDTNDATLGTLAEAYFQTGQYEEAVQTQGRKIAFWKKIHPEKPVPEKQLKKLEEYKTALEGEKEAP